MSYFARRRAAVSAPPTGQIDDLSEVLSRVDCVSRLLSIARDDVAREYAVDVAQFAAFHAAQQALNGLLVDLGGTGWLPGHGNVEIAPAVETTLPGDEWIGGTF